MKNKLLIYFLALFMGFCLIFSPNIVFNVSAATLIILCDFDGIAAGLDNFEDDFFICNNTGWANNFESSTSFDLSSPNSLKCASGGGHIAQGTLTLNYDFSYISMINFSIYEDTEVGSGDGIAIYFKDSNDNTLIYLTMGFYPVAAGNDFTAHTVSGDEVIYSTCTADQRYYVVITHLGTNIFNYSLLNSTYATLGSVEASGDYAGDWLNFSYITMNTGGDALCYLDNFIIDTTYSLPGEPPEGYLGVNCFNETSGENITDFNVLFVNQEGDAYYQYLVNNTWVVWGNLLPQGKCILTVSKTGYYPRSYVLDVEDGYFVIDGVTYTEVIVNAYLPSINLSALYYIQVIDEYLYPVEEASVRIQGWCGDTSYQNVSITETDGYGLTNVYLCWGREYQVTIRKEGFVTKTSSWIPDPAKYGSEYPKIFRIEHEGTNVNETYDPWDYIVFEGWMYTNHTIKVNYEDVIFNETINATFYTYEINASNLSSSLISTNFTTNNTFIFWVQDVNISRNYRVVLRLNHTTLGYRTMTIIISLINITDNINETDIENKFTDVFGDFKLGYVNFFFVFIPCIVLLVMPGINHNGVGIVGSSLWLGFSSMYFGVTGLALLSPFIFSLGLILFIVKGGASKL